MYHYQVHFVDIKKYFFLFSSSLGLWYVVQRTKQCLDYTCTVHLFHIIFCWYFNGVLPNYLSWWTINLIWLGFCVLNFLSILSDFLWREILTQKWLEPKAEQFSKLQFLNDKIDQNTNFAQLTSAKKATFCITLQVTYNCSAFGAIFCVSFSR